MNLDEVLAQIKRWIDNEIAWVTRRAAHLTDTIITHSQLQRLRPFDSGADFGTDRWLNCFIMDEYCQLLKERAAKAKRMIHVWDSWVFTSLAEQKANHQRGIRNMEVALPLKAML
jgi:hypothetical protein